MNFKDSYKQANQEIRPDPVFIDRLAQQMREEQRAVHRKKKWMASTGVMVAAAALCVAVVSTGTFSLQLTPEDMQNKAGMDENVSDVTFGSDDIKDSDAILDGDAIKDSDSIFDNISLEGISDVGKGFDHVPWYGNAETTEEMLEAFLALLQEGQVEAIYSSKAEAFEEAELLSEEEADALVKILQKASVTDEQYDGECIYYRAVFEDGSVVEFRIYGEEYLILND